MFYIVGLRLNECCLRVEIYGLSKLLFIKYYIEEN